LAFTFKLRRARNYRGARKMAPTRTPKLIRKTKITPSLLQKKRTKKIGKTGNARRTKKRNARSTKTELKCPSEIRSATKNESDRRRSARAWRQIPTGQAVLLRNLQHL